MGMENGSSSSGAEILKRLNKGEICEEELKKLIGTQWEKRLQWGYKSTHQEQLQFNLDFIKSLKEMEMTEEIETAMKEMEMTEEKETFNNEAYELPTKAMESVYGNKLKQSAGYFVDKSMTLDEAEEAMYKLYCERAQIKDGQTVLDVGCGHGGLAFYIAQKYRKCHVTGITNSTTQVNYIKMQSKKLGLSNVNVILADVTKYDNEMNTFDRIMAIGVIEHIKNIEQFMKKLSTWMKEDGLLFLDHLCHKSFSFPYEAIDEDDWYSGYIFPKGCLTILWSSCLLYFQDDVSVVDHWTLNGMHVARTGQEWLKKLDQNMETIREILLEQQKQQKQQQQQQQQQPAATATDAMEGGNEVEVEAAATEAVNQLVIYLKTMCIGFYVTFLSNNGEELMNAQFLFKKK